MKSNPLISIIVPVYKVEQFLTKCVDSVLAQTYSNWELLLIDNGSPDNCPVLCDEYAKKDTRIKAFHVKENRGVSSGRNKGVEEATGEYMTFLDADDTIHPEYLEVMLGLCVDNHADMSQCSHIRGDNYQFPDSHENATVNIYDNHSIFVSESANIVVWGKLYHHTVAKDILYPYGKFYEDDHTTWKYYYRAKKIAVTCRPLYYYYVNMDSTMVHLTKKPSLSFVEAYDDRVCFFKEHGREDLVACSDLQLCKSLTLTYANPLLTKEQKLAVKERFRQAWKEMRHSKVIKFKYKILFSWFSLSPGIASKVALKFS